MDLRGAPMIKLQSLAPPMTSLPMYSQHSHLGKPWVDLGGRECLFTGGWGYQALVLTRRRSKCLRLGSKAADIQTSTQVEYNLKNKVSVKVCAAVLGIKCQMPPP